MKQGNSADKVIRKAHIAATKLGRVDSRLTYWLTLDYGDGITQDFGGLDLTERHYSAPSGLLLILFILKVAEVATWEELPGRDVSVQLVGNTIYAIGNSAGNTWFVSSQGESNEARR